MSSICIGDVKISNNVFLAPMAGVTDMCFRVLCKQQGCGLVYTEMVSAKGLYFNNSNTGNLLEINDNEKPVAVQIFGSEPSIMAEIASDAVKTGACIIDINMGCPTPKIVKNGDGCALMTKPKLVGEIVKAVSSAVDVPVTVKMRSGWDTDSINVHEVASIAEENGAKAVTVHSRTREQFYSGSADWNIIKEVKKILSIPVIGNGDVFSAKDAKNMFEHTGCDAIMIGRGAQGNPWIFSQIISYLNMGIIIDEPTPSERIMKALEHTRMLVELKGEYIAIKEARKHVAWYIQGVKNAAKLRQQVNKVITLCDMEDLLLNFNNFLLTVQ